MTIRSLFHALEVDGLPPAQRLTLIYLADMEDAETNACFPLLDDLAERVGVSVSSIRKNLKGLEDAGLITRIEQFDDHGAQLPSVFVLRLDGLHGVNAGGRV